MRISPLFFAATLSIPLLVLSVVSAQPTVSQNTAPEADRSIAHSGPEWLLIAPHLPDPVTSTPEILETQGDLLRVRRFPEDALDYYAYALKRGGDPATLLNKIGVTQLEMGNVAIAHAYFERVLKLQRKDPQAWNNMGAVQFMEHNFVAAIGDYKHAIKLNKRSAVSHSNLGMAYIEQKDYSSAKPELTTALRLDPHIFQHAGTAGVSLHTLTSTDRANFCFQMAKVYARMGNEPEMLHSLETAAEAGFDVKYEMSRDSDLFRYGKDPRVVQILLVAKSLRANRIGNAVADALPPATVPGP